MSTGNSAITSYRYAIGFSVLFRRDQGVGIKRRVTVAGQTIRRRVIFLPVFSCGITVRPRFPVGRKFCETTICIYNDNADHLNNMYLIIRCPSCSTFTYVDRYQKWKLCPQCGHAQEVARTPAYLDVEDFHEAEHIVKQMQKHLHANKKKDFSPEETAELRHHYTEALRKRSRSYPVQ